MSDIRVRARALTSLSSAAGSTVNVELIGVVKELVLPKSVHNEQHTPEDGNGVCACVSVCMRVCMYVRCKCARVRVCVCGACTYYYHSITLYCTLSVDNAISHAELMLPMIRRRTSDDKVIVRKAAIQVHNHFT